MRYVADDGTEFDNEKECLEYEEHINDIKKCFILYGEKLNKLTEERMQQKRTTTIPWSVIIAVIIIAIIWAIL